MPSAQITSNSRTYFWGALAVVLIAAALRVLPHPPNFSPIAAMALFGGAYLTRGLWAVLLPVAALFLSDLALGFHSLMPAVYLSFVLVVFMGYALQERKTPARVALASVAGSLVFFAITNFAVWAEGGMYPKTMEGLVACFTLALPFLQNSLVGDLLFTGALFGGWALAARSIPALREA